MVIGLILSIGALLRPERERSPTTAETKPSTVKHETVFSFLIPYTRYNVAMASSGAALLALALIQLYLLAASGHAATVNLVQTGTGILTIPVFIDWLHVVATGVWAGGIMSITLALIPALKRCGGTALGPFLDTLDRFSPFAYASVVVLAATGGFNGKVHVPSWEAFFNAVYGRTLIVKIVLVLLMIVISAFTVGIIRPKLRDRLRGERSETEGELPARHRRGERSGSGHAQEVVGDLEAVLIRWLRISALLAGLVFIATAVLNTYPVPITFGATSGPFVLSGRSGNLSLKLKLHPGRAGPNRFTVILRKSGRPVRSANVNIIETMTDMNMGTQFIVLHRVRAGVFQAMGQVAMGGHWQFDIQVRLPSSNHVRQVLVRSAVGQ